jgi:hypothetical protein
MKMEDDEGGMGDHGDLPNVPKIFAAEETATTGPAIGAAG